MAEGLEFKVQGWGQRVKGHQAVRPADERPHVLIVADAPAGWRINESLSLSLYIYISISIYFYLSIYLSIYLYLSISIYIYLYMYIYIYVYIYIYIYIYLYIHICISIYLSIYLYIYTHILIITAAGGRYLYGIRSVQIVALKESVRGNDFVAIFSGMQIITHLDHTSHCQTASGWE